MFWLEAGVVLIQITIDNSTIPNGTLVIVHWLAAKIQNVVNKKTVAFFGYNGRVGRPKWRPFEIVFSMTSKARMPCASWQPILSPVAVVLKSWAKTHLKNVQSEMQIRQSMLWEVCFGRNCVVINAPTP